MFLSSSSSAEGRSDSLLISLAPIAVRSTRLSSSDTPWRIFRSINSDRAGRCESFKASESFRANFAAKRSGKKNRFPSQYKDPRITFTESPLDLITSDGTVVFNESRHRHSCLSLVGRTPGASSLLVGVSAIFTVLIGWGASFPALIIQLYVKTAKQVNW